MELKKKKSQAKRRELLRLRQHVVAQPERVVDITDRGQLATRSSLSTTRLHRSTSTLNSCARSSSHWSIPSFSGAPTLAKGSIRTTSWPASPHNGSVQLWNYILVDHFEEHDSQY